MSVTIANALILPPPQFPSYFLILDRLSAYASRLAFMCALLRLLFLLL